MEGNTKAVLVERLEGAMALTQDFYAQLAAAHYPVKMPHGSSNTLGEQAWCIIGARESHIRAWTKGAWDGFSCSLEDPWDKEAVLGKLKATAKEALRVLEEQPPRDTHLVLGLLEHEVQHHGQLIRFAYGLGLSFPASWKRRYTV